MTGAPPVTIAEKNSGHISAQAFSFSILLKQRMRVSHFHLYTLVGIKYMITIHSKYSSVSDWLESSCFLLKPACVDHVLKAFADINTTDITHNDIDCKGDARRVGCFLIVQSWRKQCSMRRQNGRTAALTWNDWTNNRCYLLE